jgi:SAM-dependent MidA family methyltransferase
MIARQIEEMWRLLGGKAFTIVEYGAGTGILCHDILEHLKSNTELYRELRYCIIEKSPVMREIESLHLKEKVSWHNSIRELPGINGCILSNELIDNFSVHQVMMGDELMDIFVDYEPGPGFTELLQPAGKELTGYLAELNIVLPKGFRTEINLGAIEWINEIASYLDNGYILTIDYGYPSAELYCPHRSRGTLVCYNNHTFNENPYRFIGEQDITAHVNFSALYHWGLKNGLRGCGYTNQANFLLGLGLEDYLLRKRGEDMKMEEYKREAFLKHVLLIDMGRRFKVLIQQKGSAEGIPSIFKSGLFRGDSLRYL